MRKRSKRITMITGTCLVLMTLGTAPAFAEEPENPFGFLTDWIPGPCVAGFCAEVGPVEGPEAGVVTPTLPDETSTAIEAPIVDVTPLVPLPPEILDEVPGDTDTESETPTEPEAETESDAGEPDPVEAEEATESEGPSTSSEATSSRTRTSTDSQPQRQTTVEQTESDPAEEPGVAEKQQSDPLEEQGETETSFDASETVESAEAIPASSQGNPVLYALLGALATALLVGAIGAGFAVGRRR